MIPKGIIRYIVSQVMRRPGIQVNRQYDPQKNLPFSTRPVFYTNIRCYLLNMGSIELWTGLPGSGRKVKLLDRVLNTSASGRLTWYVVDTIRRVERIETSLHEFSGGVIAGIEVMPVGKLAGFVLEASGISQPTVDTDVRELLFQQIFQDVTRVSNLGSYSSPGWIKKTVYYWEQVQEEKSLRSKLRSKYPWMVEIFDRYQDLLNDENLVDIAALPSFASVRLNGSPKNGPELLVIDTLGPQASSLNDLISKLSSKVQETIVLVDYLTNPGPALKLGENDYQRWKKNPTIKEKTIPSSERRSKLANVLFTTEKINQDKLDKTQIYLEGFRNQVEEVKAVAGKIAELQRIRNLTENQVSVVCTDLKEYSTLIEEIFPYFGLTSDIRLGKSLATHPLIHLVLQLFQLKSRKLPADDVISVLTNPYASYGKNLNSIDKVTYLDTLLKIARISGGSNDLNETWSKPLKKLVFDYQQPGSSGLTSSDKDIISDCPIEIEENLTAWIREAYREFEILAKDILKFKPENNPEEIKKWMLDLLFKLNIADFNRSELNQRFDNDLEIQQVWSSFNLVLKLVDRSLRISGVQKCHLKRYSELLKISLKEKRYRTDSKFRGGINVTGPLDIRGQRTEHIFFLGLSSKKWPRSTPVDLLEPFSANSQIKHDYLAESRALMLETILSAENLWLSAPCRIDGTSGETISPVIKSLINAGLKISGFPQDKNFYSPLDLLPASGSDLDSHELFERGRRRLSAALYNDQVTDRFGSKWSQAYNAIRIQLLRNQPETLSKFEGYIGSSKIGKIISDRVISKPLSASRLDSYAKCPLRYLFGDVLKLDEKPELIDDIDARQKGSLVHSILSTLVERLGEELHPEPSISEDPDLTVKLMLEIAGKLFKNYPFDNLFWEYQKEKILAGLADIRGEVGILGAVLKFEIKELPGETIKFTEVGFGTQTGVEDNEFIGGKFSVSNEGNEVSLSGIIDRISLSDKGKWRVWDYKVGGSSLSTLKDVKDGLSFQLFVYTIALEKYLADHSIDSENIDFACYYHIRNEGKVSKTGKWPRKDHELNKEDLVERIVKIQEAIREGRFHHPLSQHYKLCNSSPKQNYCPFFNICRRDINIFHQREDSLGKEFLDKVYSLGFQEFKSISDGDNN